jgi:peptidoglycan hydrolase-like protein with peptidoglycan-binding domain
MFSDTVIKALVDAANANGIEPAALLAIAEVETSGATFEHDGRTPQLLYERHIAWRQSSKVSRVLQSAFAAAGLAIPKWSRSTQYKDQGSSEKRLALIGKARGLSAEVANASASWGIGQTMGFLYRELGFASACAMVDHMTGSLAGQIDCMIGELKNKHLIQHLNAHNWPHVALIYNGEGYAANRYDTRLADAHKRWGRKLATGAHQVVPADMSPAEIKALQAKMRELGISAVGNPNGVAGINTVAALSAFQAHEGLTVTGKFDDATREALKTAVPVEPPRERKQATARDLAGAGSKTIKVAQRGGWLAWIKGIVGTGMLGGAAAEHGGGDAAPDVGGLLQSAQDGVDKINQAKGVWESFHDLAGPLFGHPAVIVAGVLLILSAVALAFVVKLIIEHRVADHNSGVHAGPSNGG